MSSVSNATSGWYGGSRTPSNLDPLTYNYCNAPTADSTNYQRPSQARRDGAKLVNVIYITRHFKRTPDNFVTNENAFSPASGFDCSGLELFNYGIGRNEYANSTASPIHVENDNPTSNPFHSRLWNGSCTDGQLTAGGLQDSIARGKKLLSLYGPKGVVPLLTDGINTNTVYIRTSPEERTFQVSAGIVAGLGRTKPFPVHAQSSLIDGIVPSYSCSYSDDLRTAIEQEPEWKAHLASKADLFAKVLNPLGVANDSAWTRWIDHSFDFLNARTCNGNPLPAGITQETAQAVALEGDFEYNYIWNQSPKALDYVRYSFGGFNTEFAQVLSDVAKAKGTSGPKLRLIVGHDGTMVRLFKTLAQSGQIRWPAFGSDLGVEVWKLNGKLYVRMLSYGKTFNSDAQLLTGKNVSAPVEWTPIENVIKHIQGLIPDDLLEKCS